MARWVRVLAGAVGAASGAWAPWSRSLGAALGPFRGDLQSRLQGPHLRHLALGLGELKALAESPWPAGHQVEVEGLAELKACLAEGRGALLVGGHLGLWELVGGLLQAEGIPATALVQPPTSPWAARFFAKLHGRLGLKEAPVMHEGGKPAALRPALAALRRGEVLGALVDQHGEAQRAHGSLLGRPVALPTGAFALARHTGAPLVPFAVLRLGPHHHCVAFGRPHAPFADDAEAAAWAIAWLEGAIRAQPGAWLWAHPRFDREAELGAAALGALASPSPAPALVGVGAR